MCWLPGRLPDHVAETDAFGLLSRYGGPDRGADNLSRFSFPFRTGSRAPSTRVWGMDQGDRWGQAWGTAPGRANQLPHFPPYCLLIYGAD